MKVSTSQFFKQAVETISSNIQRLQSSRPDWELVSSWLDRVTMLKKLL